MAKPQPITIDPNTGDFSFHAGPIKAEGSVDFAAGTGTFNDVHYGPATLSGTFEFDTNTSTLTDLNLTSVDLPKGLENTHVTYHDDTFKFHAGPLQASGEFTGLSGDVASGTFDAHVGPVEATGTFEYNVNEGELTSIVIDAVTLPHETLIQGPINVPPELLDPLYAG